MNEETELLREIRDLLQVMAEPALAERDEKLRGALLKIVGKGKVLAKAVLLMDGSKNQAQLRTETGIDAGNLSRGVKALREAGLVGKDEKPKIIIKIPPNFFDKIGDK
jgi:DNA-binding HxlR family transcriptional regulator